MSFTEFLNFYFLGNSTYQWLTAAVVFFATITLIKIFEMVVENRLKAFAKKTRTEIDDIILNAIKSIHWPFYVYAGVYIALGFLDIPAILQQWAYYIFLIGVTYYVIKFLQSFVEFGTDKIISKTKEESEMNEGIVRMISTLIKIALWVVAMVLILANLGYNVTSLVAGLGIGGIAIALAVQNILGDLFNSLAIYFDKPFKIGDFVVVGEYMGIVKKVGIKTTRIQALQGEELVFSNSDLMSARIQNFGVMQKRRIVFTVGVTYQTSAEKLRAIPDMVKEIINKQEQVEVDRVHFKTFGDSALIYEVVYYVLTGDYNQYMDIQEQINLGIVNRFEKEKIDIAYPTQTVFIEKE
jgi:small-conductance mechanosensitive channel